MQRVALVLALTLGCLSGCGHHNLASSPPSETPSGDFPILKGVINNNVERDSPNL